MEQQFLFLNISLLNISLCDSQSFNAIYIFALQYMKFDEYSVECSIC